ncbi:MAG TPA: PIG-L family deacetylase, partial [Candidatus Eremiobacteraceae bacterium]|nr:PIG-L family deacetylase [Candidatus Eremiobacteraceae bacterium]
IEAIDNARVTTRILYITAHPDDESSSVLTYLARGLHADVALLSLTRGEGGQNALGPEQAPQLGLIRTQELLAATRGYGVKLYFTRAKDFGFSKTPEETEKIWGDQVLADMVYVIRDFHPNIVINNWGGVHGGHGHHQAAGLLTPKAVALAADPKAYGGTSGKAWDAWDGDGTPVRILDLDRGSQNPKGYVLPLDEYSSLYGKSWREIGIDAFANHKTQGVSVFLGSPFLRRPIGMIVEDGKPFDPASLAVPLPEWLKSAAASSAACRGGASCRPLAALEADKEIAAAHADVINMRWKAAAEHLAAAGKALSNAVPRHGLLSSEGSLNANQELILDRLGVKIDHALSLVAGYELSARAERNDLVAGETVDVTASAKCRPQIECKLGKISLGDYDTDFSSLDSDVWTEAERKKDLPEDTKFVARVVAPSANHMPLAQLRAVPPIFASVYEEVTISGYTFRTGVPIEHVDATSTHVDLVPVRIAPAYAVAVEPKQEIEKLAAKHEPFNVFLRVHSYSTKNANVTVGLEVPAGWKTSGTEELSFTGEGDRYAKLTLVPPQSLAAGKYAVTAYAKRGEEKFATSIEPLPSMPSLVWEEPAQTVVHAFDINVPENLRVGYISAESEPVPVALKMLGINVEMLDANALNFGNLSKYDAIVVGVRAYELRGELPGANQRLLDFARSGGTLVVQYQRDFAWDGKNYAPYAAKIGTKQGEPLPRITDETSPVKFLKPDDPLLNTPNKITQDDFKGWVQERGLYF